MVITIRDNNRDIDIKADDKQILKNTLKILEEKNLVKLTEGYEVFSMRDNTNLDKNKSLKDNNINNGDVVTINSIQ